jgi:hypothetical protein
MTAIALAKLRLEMVEATRLSFDACRRDHPGETIYAYALVMCSAGGEALQPWCHTEESNAKREAKRPSQSKKEAGFRRYCPDEWWSIASGPVETSRGRDWDDIRTDLAALHAKRKSREPHVVLEMLIDTLESLDREEYFGTGKAREAVALMIYISDDALSDDWWPDSVRLLNPPAVRKRFEAAVE